MKNINEKLYYKFNNEWALLTAGTLEHHNTMTISWGSIGSLWSKNVATVYVRPCRYTYQFMEENEYFTISFYTNEYKEALKILGTKSGKDSDKEALAGVNAVPCGESVTFAQANCTILCKKLYCQDFDRTQVPEPYASEESVHRMYIGQIISITEG